MPVTPEEFYKANLDKEKEYVRVYPAYEVRGGEPLVVGIAEEDGYELSPNGQFLTKSEFAARTASAESLELPLVKKDLQEAGFRNIAPVPKHGKVIIQEGRQWLTAHRDGFSMNTGLNNDRIFMTSFEMSSQFNHAVKKCGAEKETLVTLINEEPVKGIIIQEKTILTFGNGDTTLLPGYFISPNPLYPGSYVVTFHHANTRLRLSPAWLAEQQTLEAAKAAHGTASARQARLNSRATRIAPKQG